MKRLDAIIKTLAAALVIAALHPVVAAAQTAKDLVGTWTLVSITYDQGGKPVDAYGPNPKGMQIMTSDGRVTLIVLNPDVPKFASNNRITGTPEENKAAVQGALAYFGAYTANDADKTWRVHIEGSTFPNWAGNSQVRTFALNGDELTITNPKGSTGASSTVVWKRLK